MREELTAYYEQSFDTLTKSLSGRVGGMANAEDIVQEAFVRALTYLDTYIPGRVQIQTWFSPILRRAMYDHKRQELRQGMTTEKLEAEESEEEFKGVDQATMGEIEEEINKRPQSHAEVLRLHILYGYPRRAIVEITDVSLTNVGTILDRFKADMKVKYEKGN